MEAAEKAVALRAFGRREDLDLDFASADRPALVTALLAQCTGLGAAHWWSRPVGQRTAALAELMRQREGVAEIEISAGCANRECGETFGFDLLLTELVALAPSAEAWALDLPEGRQLSLRPPTGSDLHRWCQAQPASREQALALMVEDLAPGQVFETQDEPFLSVALAERDPLVALRALARCPACGHEQEVEVDLEGLLLSRWAAKRQSLITEVHQLAHHYGWTEAEVLALPPTRRAEYRALIESSTR